MPLEASSIEPTRISDMKPTATPAPASSPTLFLMLHACAAASSSSVSGLNTSRWVFSENHRPAK